MSEASADIPCPSELLSTYQDTWDGLSEAEKRTHITRLFRERNRRYHPTVSLHKDLFNPENWQKWIDPRLLAAIQPWRDTGKYDAIRLDAMDGIKLEAPGIISFPAYTDEFCEKLLSEVRHYHRLGMPSRAPNSMNNYGLVLNEIGMRPVFDRLLAEAILPMGALLFGDAKHRVKTLHGKSVGTENWGGSTLDDHHSFIVQYRPDQDKHLDMHIDECDVTFNFGLTDTSTFTGNDLTFCGMFDKNDHRKLHHTYKHVKGRAVVHSGKRRHGALDIATGERASLIMWTKSTTYRNTFEYHMRDSHGLNQGPADRVCLSYTHDRDYKQLMPAKLQYRMLPKEQSDAISEASTQASSRVPKRWVRVCSDAELGEGNARVMRLEDENLQVAVWRYHGALFALDNRCSHMGGPLCEGDVEDLAKHASLSSTVKLGANANKDDGVVTCPLHGQCFNLRTGENITGGHMRQRVYPVRLTDGKDIEVEVGDEDDFTSSGRSSRARNSCSLM